MTQPLEKPQLSWWVVWFSVFGQALCYSLIFHTVDVYFAEQAEAGVNHFSPHTAVDDLIPFWPSWIWLYLSFFPFCFSLLLLVRFDQLKLKLCSIAFTAQYLVGFLIFWLLPSEMDLPPLPQQSLHRAGFAFLRSIDPGFNVFPSMHVANVTLVLFVAYAERARLFPALLAWGGLVMASTVLFKKHHFVDVPAGLAIGLLAGYWLLRRFPRPDVPARGEAPG
jgi:membrane-associated phospholipid phosphatase